MQGPPGIGLCATCQHVRVITSERGSQFYLCGAAKTDPRLRKYPPLPVLRCFAYDPGSGRAGGT
jgi:hypothetical protein